MSLDEEFSRLHDEYYSQLMIGKLSKDERSSIRKRFHPKFIEYEKEAEELSPSNQVNLYHAFCVYYCFDEIDYERFEDFCKRGIEAAKKITVPIPISKSDALSRFYADLGFVRTKQGLDDEAEEYLKKSIFYGISCDNEWTSTFYSYRRINQYLIQDLVNKELTVSNPEEFNDPVDCPFFSIRKRRSKKGKDDVLISAYRFLKIRCFVKSREDDEESDEYRNTLMWSHYAYSHKGICIRYNLNGQFPYSDEKEGIASNWEDVSYKAKEFLYDEDKSSYTLQEMFATKKPCWEYESEIRLIHYDPNHESSFKSLPLGENGKIEAVYFGLKCIKRNSNKVKKILGDDVAYFQMNEDEEDIFKLVEVPQNDKAKAMLEATSKVEVES